MDDQFEMLFTPYRHNKTFRMQVEVIQRSEQVIRFRISGGEKFITMESCSAKKPAAGKFRIAILL